MIRAGIGIGIALIWVTFFSLVKAAGMADRRLEEIQRLTASLSAVSRCISSNLLSAIPAALLYSSNAG